MKKRILLVGYSDTNLMPLCAAVLTCLCKKKNVKGIRFESCGFWAVDGRTADPLALTVAGEMGLDLAKHRAKNINEAMTAWADWVIPQDAMIAKGVRELLQRDKTKMGKIMKLSSPVSHSLESYRQSREEVIAYCNRLLRKIMADAREQKKQAATVAVVPVDETKVSQIVQLEQTCFAHPWSEQAIVSELQKPDGCFLGAFLGETMVGYGSLSLVCGVGYINNIAVHPDYRRLGIGRRVLEQLEAYCLQHKAQSITLEVRSKNQSAIGLYESQGFLSCGLRKGFYRTPADDALIMTKEFE